MFCATQTSPKSSTAKTDEKIGEVLTIGEERATPIRSMPIYPSVCPIAGAKKPAAMKKNTAGVCKRERGKKKLARDQKITALVPSEITEPVKALEPTRPRRTKICAMEKHRAA